MSSQSIFGNINSGLDKFFNFLNNNKYVFGITMLLMNISSKYLIQDLSAPFHKALFSSKLVRRIAIFCILFIATRDFKISLILTAVFIILFLNLFNDRSSLCILPKTYKNLDTNLDGEITPDEIERAYNILKKTGKLPSNAKKEGEHSEQDKTKEKKNDPNKIKIDVNDRRNNINNPTKYVSF